MPLLPLSPALNRRLRIDNYRLLYYGLNQTCAYRSAHQTCRHRQRGGRLRRLASPAFADSYTATNA